MMRKVFLMLFVLMSFNSFSQLHVKEGSFKRDGSAVIEDKDEHYDDNYEPMARIKISTVNINEAERMRLAFKSNRATQIKKEYINGQVWLYISKAADFLEISHPDYSLITYKLPETLCGFCVYDMTLEYISPSSSSAPVQQKKYPLIVKADQSNATIYIDDELLDIGEAYKTVDEGTTHTYKIECNLYHTETGTVTVNDRTVINKTLRPAFGYINVSTSPEQDAKVFVDGNYLGLSPIKTDKLASGTHTVRVMKEMFKMKEQSFTVNDGQTTNANITMEANFVNVTVNTDSQSDIYVDEEYKGKGRWTGIVSDGSHIFEARKTNHRPTNKTVDLVLGETKTITLDAPKPINGSCEISSSPMGATIYIDGKSYGETPNYVNDIIIGTHELKLEKQGCTPITKTITIKENETLTVNEKLVSQETTDNRQQTSGNVSQDISGTINGHEYVDLGLSVKWATCNVGASKPEDYGNYYAWGETSTKSTYYESNSKTYWEPMNDIKGSSQYDAARANWGGTWRLPTEAELEELKNKCTWTWTAQNGVKGYKVTGPNGNSIFLPAAGNRYGSSLYDAGEYGFYWSSMPDNIINEAYYLYFDSGYQKVYGWGNHCYGRSVRPVSDVSVNNETFTVNGVSFKMIKVEGGTFQMGATSEQGSDVDSDEKPVHSVTLSDYYIGETEVTVGLFRKFINETGYRTDADKKGGSSIWNGSEWVLTSGVNWQCDVNGKIRSANEDNHPVIHVSWNDANEFCEWLNNKTGKNFRLPTEAEWEYAARGGNKFKGYKYSGSNTIGNVAWYWDNSSFTTHNVKTKSPNELGIYDMSGNVWEWCEDWYGNYSSGSQTNPAGPWSGSFRVLRGGGWNSDAKNCRVSDRNYDSPGCRRYNSGFRVVRDEINAARSFF